ncbi:ABC transporter permease [Flavobacterium sp. GT3P67]|nr:ABC transporter permease [Flavobacterium sp. GT3P67]
MVYCVYHYLIFLDILKNKIVLAYTIILAILSWSSFGLEDNSAKGLLTILNIILFTVPLVSILFATIYLYNSSEFIELLLSQPIKRKKIWLSLFLGLSLSMVLAFFIGAGIPLLVYAPDTVGIMMLIVGCLISLVFVALAFLSSILTRDKSKGIGIAIMSWLYFALLFDGIVLFLLFQFSDYPIEKAMVAVTALSPIDLARIQILLQLDASAMMGYTGAIFKDFFGTSLGLLISFLLLCLWLVVPFFISLIKFKNKDL